MKLLKTDFNFSFDSGGLGDCIARLPAIQWIYDQHPHIAIHLWVPVFFKDYAIAALPKDKKRIIVRDFTEFKKYKRAFHSKAFSAHKLTNLACHMTDHAFLIIGNCQVEDGFKNYLPVEPVDISHLALPSKEYVVVTAGYTSGVREWLPEHINAVVSHIKSSGYEAVFLGKTETPNGTGHVIQGTFSEEIDYSQGTNLLDKTNLLEAITVMGGAKAVVGLDNGLLHAAACTDVAIVGGFTSVLPEHRMPYRKGFMGWNFFPVTLTEKELACIGCQSKQIYAFNHSFTNCLEKPAAKGKDIKCLSLLSADKYIEELEKIL